MKIKTCIAEVTIPCNIFAGYKTGELQSVSLVITNGNKSNFSMDVQEQIGQRPVVEIFFRINRQKFSWQNENIPVKVSIAYTPTKEEMEEHQYIVIWHIDDNGSENPVSNGRYDPESGMVTFTTTGFSQYAVAYMHKVFGDLDSVSWAKKPKEVMASKA